MTLMFVMTKNQVINILITKSFKYESLVQLEE